jgi:hypothetical protein
MDRRRGLLDEHLRQHRPPAQLRRRPDSGTKSVTNQRRSASGSRSTPRKLPRGVHSGISRQVGQGVAQHPRRAQRPVRRRAGTVRTHRQQRHAVAPADPHVATVSERRRSLWERAATRPTAPRSPINQSELVQKSCKVPTGLGLGVHLITPTTQASYGRPIRASRGARSTSVRRVSLTEPRIRLDSRGCGRVRTCDRSGIRGTASALAMAGPAAVKGVAASAGVADSPQ